MKDCFFEASIKTKAIYRPIDDLLPKEQFKFMISYNLPISFVNQDILPPNCKTYEAKKKNKILYLGQVIDIIGYAKFYACFKESECHPIRVRAAIIKNEKIPPTVFLGRDFFNTKNNKSITLNKTYLLIIVNEPTKFEWSIRLRKCLKPEPRIFVPDLNRLNNMNLIRL